MARKMLTFIHLMTLEQRMLGWLIITNTEFGIHAYGKDVSYISLKNDDY